MPIAHSRPLRAVDVATAALSILAAAAERRELSRAALFSIMKRPQRKFRPWCLPLRLAASPCKV